jgi:DDE superfamily endonuclease/Homeodomain-like domain
MASSCELSPAEHDQLQQWLAACGTPQQVALRCRIVLASAEGQSDVAIAEQLSVNRKTVILWRSRFSEERLDGLWEIAPGRGRKPTYDIDKIAAVVEATLQTKPPGMTHWSCRTMAKSQGVSKSTVNRIWQAHNLKPHRVERFKLSRDPKCLEKMTDVVGLYLNPPQQALVLCVDEKSQIQALDRTQPGLPIKKGRCGTTTHDYKRNGTTTLFAALETLQGKVIGQCYQRHRHQELLKFLRTLDKEFPGKASLHLIMDNYGTHTTLSYGLLYGRQPLLRPIEGHVIVRIPRRRNVRRIECQHFGVWEFLSYPRYHFMPHVFRCCMAHNEYLVVTATLQRLLCGLVSKHRLHQIAMRRQP